MAQRTQRFKLILGASVLLNVLTFALILTGSLGRVPTDRTGLLTQDVLLKRVGSDSVAVTLPAGLVVHEVHDGGSNPDRFMVLVNDRDPSLVDYSVDPSLGQGQDGAHYDAELPEFSSYFGTWLVTYGNGYHVKMSIRPDGTATKGRVLYRWSGKNGYVDFSYEGEPAERIKIHPDGTSLETDIARSEKWHWQYRATRISTKPDQDFDLFELCSVARDSDKLHCVNVGSNERCYGTRPWDKTTARTRDECVQECPILLDRLSHDPDPQVQQYARKQSCPD